MMTRILTIRKKVDFLFKSDEMQLDINFRDF